MRVLTTETVPVVIGLIKKGLEKHMEKSLGQSTSINYKSEFIRNRPHTKEGFALKANFISPVVPYDHGLDPALQENIAD